MEKSKKQYSNPSPRVEFQEPCQQGKSFSQQQTESFQHFTNTPYNNKPSVDSQKYNHTPENPKTLQLVKPNSRHSHGSPTKTVFFPTFQSSENIQYHIPQLNHRKSAVKQYNNSNATPATKAPYLSCVSNQTLSYIILFIASFFIVASFIYSNQNNISVMETSLSRYTMQIIMSYLICRLNKRTMEYQNPVQFRKLIFRSIIFTMNTAVLAWAQFYLPLYVVHTIGSMGPVFVCIINYYIHNMKITQNQINGNILAFIGIFFTINGKSITSIFFDIEFTSEFENYRTDNEFIMFLVSVAVFFATFLWSYGVATTKNCQSSIPQIIHHQSVTGMLLASTSYMLVSNPVPMEVFYKSLFFVGFIQALAIIAFNFAIYIAVNTNLTSIMVQNVILVSYVIGIFRYNEKIDYVGVFGAGLLIAGVTIVILSKS